MRKKGKTHQKHQQPSDPKAILRQILSLRMPRCSICTTNWFNDDDDDNDNNDDDDDDNDENDDNLAKSDKIGKKCIAINESSSVVSLEEKVTKLILLPLCKCSSTLLRIMPSSDHFTSSSQSILDRAKVLRDNDNGDGSTSDDDDSTSSDEETKTNHPIQRIKPTTGDRICNFLLDELYLRNTTTITTDTTKLYKSTNNNNNNNNTTQIRHIPQKGMCKPCLTKYIANSHEVLTHNYRSTNEPDVKFSVELKCPSCRQKFSARTLTSILQGTGKVSSSAEKEMEDWFCCVGDTIRMVQFCKRLRRIVRRGGDVVGVVRLGGLEENDVLGSWLLEEGEDHSSDDCFSDDDTVEYDDDGRRRQQSVAALPRKKTQIDAKPGELKEELLKKDPLFRQEIEDEEFIRNKRLTKEGRQELGLEAAGEVDDQQRVEQEKMDARLAKEIHNELNQQHSSTKAPLRPLQTQVDTAAADRSSSSKRLRVPTDFFHEQSNNTKNGKNVTTANTTSTTNIKSARASSSTPISTTISKNSFGTSRNPIVTKPKYTTKKAKTKKKNNNSPRPASSSSSPSIYKHFQTTTTTTTATTPSKKIPSRSRNSVLFRQNKPSESPILTNIRQPPARDNEWGKNHPLLLSDISPSSPSCDSSSSSSSSSGASVPSIHLGSALKSGYKRKFDHCANNTKNSQTIVPNSTARKAAGESSDDDVISISDSEDVLKASAEDPQSTATTTTTKKIQHQLPNCTYPIKNSSLNSRRQPRREAKKAARSKECGTTWLENSTYEKYTKDPTDFTNTAENNSPKQSCSSSSSTTYTSAAPLPISLLDDEEKVRHKPSIKIIREQRAKKKYDTKHPPDSPDSEEKNKWSCSSSSSTTYTSAAPLRVSLIDDEKQITSSSTSCSTLAAAAAAAAPSRISLPDNKTTTKNTSSDPTSVVDHSALSLLVGMGFKRSMCKVILRDANNDTDLAIKMILSENALRK